MFSPSSPAAATGPFLPAQGTDSATAPEAGSAPAGSDGPSFGDALSAAVDHDDPEAEAAGAGPAHTTSAHNAPAAHTPVAGADKVAPGRKACSRGRFAVEDIDPTAEHDETTVVAPTVAATLPGITPAPGRPLAFAAADGTPGGQTGAPESAIHIWRSRLQAGHADSTTDTVAATNANATAAASFTGTDDPAEVSGQSDAMPEALLRGRAHASPREAPTTVSASMRTWRDAQAAPASTSTTRPQAAPGNPVDTALNPQPAAAPRESTAAMLLQQSLTARTMTAAPVAHTTSMQSEEAPVLPESVAEQMIEAIQLQSTAGGGVARIQLEPVHFGELTVSVRVEQGQVTARLEAANPAVREWLQTNHALLRSGLAEHNLTLDRLEVGEPPEARDAERRRHSHAPPRDDQGRQPRRSPRAHTGELFEIVA